MIHVILVWIALRCSVLRCSVICIVHKCCNIWMIHMILVCIVFVSYSVRDVYLVYFVFCGRSRMEEDGENRHRSGYQIVSTNSRSDFGSRDWQCERHEWNIVVTYAISIYCNILHTWCSVYVYLIYVVLRWAWCSAICIEYRFTIPVQTV